MIIVYASKTGFTKRYAELLASRTGLKAYALDSYKPRDSAEEVIFLGWMKVGRIQGYKKASRANIIAVCASGTGRTAEPSEQAVIAKNKLQGLPFFYLRGGCVPLRDLKGFDRLLMSMFVNGLKKREQRDERLDEAIHIIENGFDGVRAENLDALVDWLKENKGYPLD